MGLLIHRAPRDGFISGCSGFATRVGERSAQRGRSEDIASVISQISAAPNRWLKDWSRSLRLKARKKRCSPGNADASFYLEPDKSPAVPDKIIPGVLYPAGDGGFPYINLPLDSLFSSRPAHTSG